MVNNKAEDGIKDNTIGVVHCSSSDESNLEFGNVAVKSDIGHKLIAVQMLVHLWHSMKFLNP